VHAEAGAYLLNHSTLLIAGVQMRAIEAATSTERRLATKSETVVYQQVA
jgi:hypothetical protein